MIIRTRTCGLLLLSVLAVAVLAGCSGKSASTANAVATVNGVGISKLRFNEAVTRSEQSFTQQGKKPDPKQLADLKKNVLDTLISQELLYQESKKEKIVVTTKQVDAQLSSLKARFKDEKEFEQALKTAGMTQDSLRQDLERSLAIQDLVKKNVLDAVSVTTAEEQKFYDDNTSEFKMPERVHARHILIKVTKDMTAAEKAAAKTKAEQIDAELKKGADFATLAKKYSQDGSAAQGGDLGTFSKGQMVPEFEKAAFSLDVNQISNVVETQFGYHIIQVLKKFPPETAKFADVKQQINQYLLQKKQSTAVQDYIDKLKKGSDVKELIKLG